MENTEKLLTDILQKIDNLNQEVRTEFKGVNDRLTEVEKSIVKLDEKVAGIDKRLSNEETISRTAFGAIAGGTVLAVLKYWFFPN
ncbi:MAG: Bdr protein [Cyanobacteria bacterium J06621_8]